MGIWKVVTGMLLATCVLVGIGLLLATRGSAADPPLVSELLPDWTPRTGEEGEPLPAGVLWQIGDPSPWLIGHGAVTYSADGTRIYVIADERVELRDAATLELLAESPHVGAKDYAERRNDCVFVDASRERVYLVTRVTGGYAVRLIDPDTLAVLHEWETVGPTRVLADTWQILEDGRLMLSCVGPIGDANRLHTRIYDPVSKEETHLPVAQTVQGPRFSRDATRTAQVSDGRIQITTLATGKVVSGELPPLVTKRDLPIWRERVPTWAQTTDEKLTRILSDRVQPVAWMPDGQSLLIWSGDVYLRVNANTAEIEARIPTEIHASCWKINVHPSGAWAIANVMYPGRRENFTEAIDLKANAVLRREKQTVGITGSISFLGEDRFHISSSRLVYTYPSLRAVPTTPRTDSRNQLWLTEDGKRVVTRGLREHEWDLQTGAHLATRDLPAHLATGNWRMVLTDDLELDDDVKVADDGSSILSLLVKRSADDVVVNRWTMPGRIDGRLASPSGRYVMALCLETVGTGDAQTFGQVAILIDREKEGDGVVWTRHLKPGAPEAQLIWLADDSRGVLVMVDGDYQWWAQDSGETHSTVKMPSGVDVEEISEEALLWHPARHWMVMPDTNDKPGTGRYFLVDLTGKAKANRIAVDTGDKRDFLAVGISDDQRIAVVSVHALGPTWIWLVDAQTGAVICRFPDEYSIIANFDVTFSADMQYLLIDVAGQLTCYDLAALLAAAKR